MKSASRLWSSFSDRVRYQLDYLKKMGLSGADDSAQAVLKQENKRGSEDVRQKRDVRVVRLDNNQVIWLQFDAPRKDVEQEYQNIKVYEEPLETDKSIIAALVSLETKPIDDERLQKAFLIHKVNEDVFNEYSSIEEASLSKESLSRLFRGWRDALREAQQNDPMLRDANEGDSFAALEAMQTFHCIEDLLRCFRPEYDDLDRYEQAALVEATCTRVSDFQAALQRLVAFLEYGKPGKGKKGTTKKLKPGVENARRDIQAALLKDVEGLSTKEIAERQGDRPVGEFNKIKNDHPTARARVKRGRDMLQRAWGEEGWFERVEAMKTERERRRNLSEEERLRESLAEIVADSAGIPTENALPLIQSDEPNDSLDVSSALLWVFVRSAYKTWGPER